MSRCVVLAFTALAAACASSVPYPSERSADAQTSAAAIHDRVLTLDSHIDVPLNYATAEVDPGGFTTLRADLPKMRAGGLDGAFFIVYAPQRALDEAGYAEALGEAETRWRGITRMINAYPDQIGLALTADDVERIHAEGRLVALLGMENAYPLGPSLDDLPMWVERGIRYVSPTHFGHNQFGDSAQFNTPDGPPPPLHGGLSELGRELVVALNRHGVMADVSHVSRETMLDMVALSAAPVIASHSGATVVADSVRNLDDEQIIALAESGGVVQLVALGAYVRTPSAEQMAAIEAIRQDMGLLTFEARRDAPAEVAAEYRARLQTVNQRFPAADVSDFIDHIDHVVALVGVEHVGISSDFDGGGGIVGWRDASETMNVTAELLARGYTEDEIALMWGGNLLRVMREVEAVAARLQAEEAAGE